jgi:hypothetical protein
VCGRCANELKMHCSVAEESRPQGLESGWRRAQEENQCPVDRMVLVPRLRPALGQPSLFTLDSKRWLSMVSPGRWAPAAQQKRNMHASGGSGEVSRCGISRPIPVKGPGGGPLVVASQTAKMSGPTIRWQRTSEINRRPFLSRATGPPAPTSVEGQKLDRQHSV